MVQKHSRQNRIEIFYPGDFVTLAVPRLDRASTDPSHLLCRVLKVKYQKSHQLQCQYGILDRWFPTNQLLRVPTSEYDDINKKLQNISTVITLHTAAAKQSTSDRISISCNCKSKC